MCRLILISKVCLYILIAAYRNEESGQNCQSDLLVITRHECQIAASKIGSSLILGSARDSKKPAGCYIFLESNQVGFNFITDPTLTSPKENYAGLCRYGKFKSLRACARSSNIFR